LLELLLMYTDYLAWLLVRGRAGAGVRAS